MDNQTASSPSPAAPQGQPVSGKRIVRTVLLVLLVILLIGAAYVLFVAKDAMKNNPLLQDLSASAPMIMEMNNMTQSQLEEQGQAVTAVQLMADPEVLKGGYAVVTGFVGRDESMLIQQNMAMNSFEDSGSLKGLMLDPGLVVVDITKEVGDLADGTEIKAFGKVLVARIEDIFALPWVGPDLEREFGNVEGMSDKIVFFITKGVEVMSTPAPMEGEDAAEADGAAAADGAAETEGAEGEAADGAAAGGEAEEGHEGHDHSEGEAEHSEGGDDHAEGEPEHSEGGA